MCRFMLCFFCSIPADGELSHDIKTSVGPQWSACPWKRTGPLKARQYMYKIESIFLDILVQNSVASRVLNTTSSRWA